MSRAQSRAQSSAQSHASSGGGLPKSPHWSGSPSPLWGPARRSQTSYGARQSTVTPVSRGSQTAGSAAASPVPRRVLVAPIPRFSEAQDGRSSFATEPEPRSWAAELLSLLLAAYYRAFGWVFLATDDMDMRVRKHCFNFVNVVGIPLYLPSLLRDAVVLAAWVFGGEQPSMAVMKAPFHFATMYFGVRMYWTRTVSDLDCNMYTLLTGIITLVADYIGQVEASTSSDVRVWAPVWPMNVIVMDMALVWGAAGSVEVSILAATALYGAARISEDCYRYGFYDALQEPNRTDTLPVCPEYNGVCPKGGGAGQIVQAFARTIFVLLCDYIFTRNFRDKARASIRVAEDVAAAMVRFDLPEAGDRLRKAEGVPDRLRLAFGRLLQNLHRYRPFLPDALFEVDVSDLAAPKRGKRKRKVLATEPASSPSASSPSNLSPGAAFAAKSRSFRQQSHSSEALSDNSSGSNSQSTPHSASSSVSTLRSAAPAQIIQTGLTKRPVAVLSVAVRPWEWITQTSSAEVESAAAAWLGCVWERGKAAKATIIGVRAQAAMLAWGTLTRVALTPACLKAAGCATAIVQSMLDEPMPNGAAVRCGIVASQCQVGNLGSADFKEHCVLGAVPPISRMLCTFGQHVAASVLSDRSTALNIENEWEVRLLDRWGMMASGTPPEQQSPRPFDVYQIQGEKAAAETDEWMYQLEAQEAAAKGRAAHYTAGIQQLMCKVPDAAAAASAFARHLADAPGDTAAAALRDAASAHCATTPYVRRVWRDPSWALFPAAPAPVSDGDTTLRDASDVEELRDGSEGGTRQGSPAGAV
eukprot:TRINITY_DN1583_c0_g1_i1.p1 TRINITY_DN1583_c0_g1~~TRINITY_DN1583_c0_g1_i1.p1  ORF type:complete len:811 (+),score=253.25 TRINITY_DN1583_c0_g1_i1:89-2521(+)